MTCDPDQFRCKTGKCIPMQFVCDSEDDCEDAEVLASTGDSTIDSIRLLSSDEIGCQRHCQERQFTCKNSTLCIPLSWVCDGVFDCPSQSDEKLCNNTQCKYRVPLSLLFQLLGHFLLSQPRITQHKLLARLMRPPA